jgi:hypothetical protein
VVAAGRRFDKAGTAAGQLKRLGDDWLLLRLNTCLGKSLGHADIFDGPVPLYMTVHVEDAGYPIDRNSRKGLTIDPSCKFTGWGGIAALMNDCAVKPGNSGGPIFRLAQIGGKQRLEIFAIETFGYDWSKPVTDDNRWYNAATPATTIGPLIRPFLALDDFHG